MGKKISDDLLDDDLNEMREILAKEANQMANRANEMGVIGAAIVLFTLAGTLYRAKEAELAVIVNEWLKEQPK
jgi:hypothetical protein